jgi:ABC-2 type transport system permease protein
MVGVFAGLKWRLVSSRFRNSSGSGKAWQILGWGAAVLVLLSISTGLVALRTEPDSARNVVISLFTLQMVSWVLAPLVAFGIDETVDPARFALLPLTTGTLQRGLLMASLIGYLPVANGLVLLGAAVALSSSWSLLPIALVCAAFQLLLCMVASRAASTAMSGLMSGRRGRDLGMAIGSILFLLYLGLSFALNRAGASSGSGASFGSGVRTVAQALTWGPNGALAAVPSFVHGGQWGRLLMAVTTPVGVIGVLWWWWSVALLRSMTSAPSTSEASAPAGRADSAAVADSLGGMVAMIVARDRVLTWRDPMRRIPWLMVVALAVVWPLLVVQGHGSLYAVAFPAVMMGMQAGNQFGVEGTGVWLHMVAFADQMRARGEALGHAVFVAVPGAVIVVLAVLLQAIIRRDLPRVPGALGICLALMLGSIACVGYLSARMPYAMRQSRKSMFANGIPGQKGRNTATVFASAGGGLVVALPAIALTVMSVTLSAGWGWVALVVGPLCGAASIVASSSWTARVYRERMPEILTTVALGDRS